MAHACSKAFLSILNSLLIIFGIALIVLSLYRYNKYQSIHLIIGVIILAFFILFIGILGLIGAVKQSKCALSVYIIFIAPITLALLTILIILYLKRNWFINAIVDNYEKYVTSSQLLDDEKNVDMTRDSFIQMQCCGFKEKNRPKKIFNQIDFCNVIDRSKPLCDEKMKNDLHQNLVTVIIIHAILTGLSTLACIVAAYLACITSNETRYDTF
ncbi:unnamed protein product [Rotaria sp. Silwood2]|nr:unnamed protein product [Rotaria sp. Silwood2]CAF2716279.1 unnamed protein product [Rotaria sp. Silwood2]CAF2940617.1 unnamed protein product [Rotaria sp. Silwood2]CAF3294911.1 unnamed protein product [Rotaria sp. Silwood2]CAF3878970.1 unnamed protein product [Rotaria sp. Silwood2]